MCIDCYKEKYGAPKIVNERTKQVASLIDRIYERAGAGGNAHIVVDDWNLEDSNIDYCLQRIAEGGWPDDTPEMLAEQKEALEALRAMGMDERASAMAIHSRLLS